MNASTEGPGHASLLRATATQHPIAAALAVLIATAVLLRVVGGGLEKRRLIQPARLPLEVALISAAVEGTGVLSRLVRSLFRQGFNVFGITPGHTILVGAEGPARLFANPQVFEKSTSGWTFGIRCFGLDDTKEMHEKHMAATKALTTTVERAFTNDASSTASILRGNVHTKASNLVTLGRTEKLERWEHLCQRRSRDDGIAVEANLHKLLRDFGACVAIPLWFGQDFLDRCPDLLSDFWEYDNKGFAMLVVGIPKWAPIKALRQGVAAQARVTLELESLFRRVDQYQNGDPVESGADMSDISDTLQERNRIYAKHGFTVRQRGQYELGMLWAQNANTQPTLFWYICRIYATPGLLDEIRREIAPVVRLAGGGGGGDRPSEELRIASYDMAGLCHACPLLKASLFEVFRLYSTPVSFRYINQPVTIDSGGRQHDLRAGSWISWTHATTQKDPGLYSDPDRFDPGRFVEVDDAAQKRARYGKLRPWGVGAAICKGRAFAEKELLVAAAAIVSLWDMEPADGGEWTVPAVLPGTGVAQPAEDVRVVLRKRSWSDQS